MTNSLVCEAKARDIRIMTRQVSFLVPYDAIPARVGILLTLSLCAINTLNSVVANSPKSGGSATALVKWNWVCFGFIVMAGLEYSWILCFKKYMSSTKVASGKGRRKSTLEERSKRLDLYMLTVFPLVFFVPSAIFWLTCQSDSILKLGIYQALLW